MQSINNFLFYCYLDYRLNIQWALIRVTCCRYTTLKHTCHNYIERRGKWLVNQRIYQIISLTNFLIHKDLARSVLFSNKVRVFRSRGSLHRWIRRSILNRLSFPFQSVDQHNWKSCFVKYLLIYRFSLCTLCICGISYC